MPARLFCEIGELAGSAYAIEEEAGIGRERENEIVLHPGFVSGRHARIFFDTEEDRYFIEDLGSSNGTLLDGVPVTEPMRLDRLHVITFANALDFIFQRVTPAAAARDQAARRDAEAATIGEKTLAGDAFDALLALPEEPEAPGEKTRLAGDFAPLPPLPEAAQEAAPETEPEVAKETAPEAAKEAAPEAAPEAEKEAEADDTTKLGGYFAALRTETFEEAESEEVTRAQTPPDDLGEAVTITREALPEQAIGFVLEVTLHGGQTMTLPLREGGNVLGRVDECDLTIPDPSISRNHALLTVRGPRVWVKDLGSKNGTYIGGEQCTAEVEISAETLIRFGLGIYANLRENA